MHRGYIKYWRKIKEWSWYKDPITKSLFLHLIAEANYKDNVFMGHTIKRGQIAVGRKELAEKLGISQQNVRTSIKRLKSTSDITIKSTNRFSIISIVNYESYQQELTSKLTNKTPSTNQQLTTIKEREERKEINKGICKKCFGKGESLNKIGRMWFCDCVVGQDLEKEYKMTSGAGR